MAFGSIILKNMSNLRNLSSFHRRFTSGIIVYTKSSSTNPPTKVNPKVSGLSKNVVKEVKEPVGPGASKDSDYKNPEYYCYNRLSFYEAEIEMASYRCPQPSNRK